VRPYRYPWSFLALAGLPGRSSDAFRRRCKTLLAGVRKCARISIFGHAKSVYIIICTYHLRNFRSVRDVSSSVHGEPQARAARAEALDPPGESARPIRLCHGGTISPATGLARTARVLVRACRRSSRRRAERGSQPGARRAAVTACGGGSATAFPRSYRWSPKAYA
jgi:hypothetical protein